MAFFISWQVHATGVSAIFIVNGDASLSYYLNNKKHDGGDNALKSAREFALSCGNCEVAIFSLSPRAKDKAYFYRNEALLAQKSYSRKKTGYRFEFEAQWYGKNTDGQHQDLVLSFFGHELTSHQSAYFNSTRATYSQGMFIEDISKFLKRSDKFSLMILSTCQNGKESNAMNFEHLTRFLIGSTVNLNLRMIETKGLIQGIVNAPKAIVDESFEEIAKIDNTEIGIVAYDFECRDLCPYLKYRKNKFLRK